MQLFFLNILHLLFNIFMNNNSPKSAIISVYNKTGIEKVAKKFQDLNITIISKKL